MIKNNTYKTIKNENLPSKGLPYHSNLDDTSIAIKPFMYSDLEYFKAMSEGEMLNYIKQNNIVSISNTNNLEPIPVPIPINKGLFELTLGDWAYLHIAILNYSCVHMVYSPEKDLICKKCDTVIDLVDIVNPNDCDNISELTGSVLHKGCVIVNKLEPVDLKDGTFIDFKSPVELDTVNGLVTMDFFRIADYVSIFEIKDDINSREIVSMLGKDGLDALEGFSITDFQLFQFIKNSMDHGLSDDITITCNKCKSKILQTVDWSKCFFMNFPISLDDVSMKIKTIPSLIKKD
jgi:hypothetical protein